VKHSYFALALLLIASLALLEWNLTLQSENTVLSNRVGGLTHDRAVGAILAEYDRQYCKTPPGPRPDTDVARDIGAAEAMSRVSIAAGLGTAAIAGLKECRKGNHIMELGGVLDPHGKALR
jgi:hypothetical protein